MFSLSKSTFTVAIVNTFACTHPPSLWALLVRPKCLSQLVSKTSVCGSVSGGCKSHQTRMILINLETGRTQSRLSRHPARFESESSKNSSVFLNSIFDSKASEVIQLPCAAKYLYLTLLRVELYLFSENKTC